MDAAGPGVEVRALLQPRASPRSGMEQHIHLPIHIQAALGWWRPCVFPAPVPDLQSGSWASLGYLSWTDWHCYSLALSTTLTERNL